jgi:hypothetical protein
MLAGTRDHGRVTRIRDLADALVHRMFSHDPFLATSMGVREYDARVPDLSPAARDSFAKAVAAVRAEAITAEPQEPQEAEERIIRAAVIAGCDRVADRNAIEAETHTVAETPLEGPPVLFATAARTVLPDEQAAADYLGGCPVRTPGSRSRRSGSATAARLRGCRLRHSSRTPSRGAIASCSRTFRLHSSPPSHRPGRPAPTRGGGSGIS